MIVKTENDLYTNTYRDIDLKYNAHKEGELELLKHRETGRDHLVLNAKPPASVNAIIMEEDIIPYLIRDIFKLFPKVRQQVKSEIVREVANDINAVLERHEKVN